MHAPDTQRDKSEPYGGKQFPRPRARMPRSGAKVLSSKVKGSAQSAEEKVKKSVQEVEKVKLHCPKKSGRFEDFKRQTENTVSHGMKDFFGAATERKSRHTCPIMNTTRNGRSNPRSPLSRRTTEREVEVSPRGSCQEEEGVTGEVSVIGGQRHVLHPRGHEVGGVGEKLQNNGPLWRAISRGKRIGLSS